MTLPSTRQRCRGRTCFLPDARVAEASGPSRVSLPAAARRGQANKLASRKWDRARRSRAHASPAYRLLENLVRDSCAKQL